MDRTVPEDFVEINVVAQDLSQKRRRHAENSTIQVNNLVNALIVLQQLRDERLQNGDWTDAELADPSGGFDLMHLTPAILGTLYDFVIPSLLANYLDVANGNRNKNILLQVKK